MSKFKHSIVLFTGEDGLPLEFNIVNAIEKEQLKAIIEHGGGLCIPDGDAIHLVSPGTKVLNVDFNKKILSSNFIFDCAEKNFLLDMSNYEIKITEIEISDISDDSGSIVKPYLSVKNVSVTDVNIAAAEIIVEEQSPQSSNYKTVCSDVCSEDFQPAKSGIFTSTPLFPPQEVSPGKVVAMDLITEEPSLIEQGIEEYTSVPNKDIQDMDLDMENPLLPGDCIEEYSNSSKLSIVHDLQAQTKETSIKSYVTEGEISDRTPSDLQFEGIQISDSELISKRTSSEKVDCLVMKPCLNAQKTTILPDKSHIIDKSMHDSDAAPEKRAKIIVTAASSSQPHDEMDEFDFMVLKKSQRVHVDEEEEPLSQSYTVSSSADAQTSNKADVSAEIFEDNFADELNSSKQDSQLSARQAYIQNLEKEIEKILEKPSPKSLQDKICMVKYICCVKRLPPAEVLQSLDRI